MSDAERAEQRSNYVMLTQSVIDHNYSSSVMQGAEKLADDNKKLRLLVEKLVHRFEAEKTKYLRVQNSLAKACSMLEQCSEYEFFDHDGHKIARPRDSSKKKGIKKPIITARPKYEVPKQPKTPKSKVQLPPPPPPLPPPPPPPLPLVQEEIEPNQIVTEAPEAAYYTENGLVYTPQALQQAEQPHFYQVEQPMHEDYLQHPESAAVEGDATMIYVASTDEAAQAVQDLNAVQFESGNVTFLLDPSAINPDGTGKIEFANILQ